MLHTMLVFITGCQTLQSVEKIYVVFNSDQKKLYLESDSCFNTVHLPLCHNTYQPTFFMPTNLLFANQPSLFKHYLVLLSSISFLVILSKHYLFLYMLYCKVNFFLFILVIKLVVVVGIP